MSKSVLSSANIGQLAELLQGRVAADVIYRAVYHNDAKAREAVIAALSAA
jgi:hypothetical protein